MEYKLKVYSIWHVGQRKDANGNPHQEDSLYPYFGEETEKDRTFILCDGMGGHDAGEVASAAVCDAMSASVKNDGHDSEGIFTDDDFNKALNDAYDALDSRDSGAVKKMGTTMTFLKLHKHGATIAHIGDSRVYHIRPGKTAADTQILFQTQDHSLVNDLVRVGEMTREEARHSKKKNIITRAMQPNVERRSKADIYHTSDIKPGDFFYMCSDGMLEKDEMDDGTALKNIFSEVIAEDFDKKEILKGATKDNSDNHTAFIIHITDVILTEDDKKRRNYESDSDIEHVAIVEGEDTESDSLVKSKGNNDKSEKEPDKISKDSIEESADKNFEKESVEILKSDNKGVLCEKETEKKNTVDKEVKAKSRNNTAIIIFVIFLLLAFLCYKYVFNKDSERKVENKELLKHEKKPVPNSKEIKTSTIEPSEKKTVEGASGKIDEKDDKEREKITAAEDTTNSKVKVKKDSKPKNEKLKATAKDVVSNDENKGKKNEAGKDVDNAVGKLKAPSKN